MKNIFIITILVLVTLKAGLAQKGYELGGWIGISNYYGEMNPGFNLSEPGLALGLNFRLLFNDRIALKSSVSYGSLKGSDADSYNTFERMRNLSFRSPVVDFTNQLEFNFLPYVHGSHYDYYTPYVLAGINIFYYDPKAELNGKWYSLREMGTEGQALGEEYFEFSAGLTVGGGFKWDITHKLSVNVEATYRFVATDYLDDVSTTYPNFQELESLRGKTAVLLSDRSGIPGFAVQGKQRGNSRDNDRFSFIGVSLMYYFGYLECPPINRFSF